MTRPSRPPHDGVINNRNTFAAARQNLVRTGPQNLVTNHDTPFTAEAHVTEGGNHDGQDCIKVTQNGESRAYIYACCWGHVTNCSGTYIDAYSPLL